MTLPRFAILAKPQITSDLSVSSLHKRRFAHSPRAPQQGIVSWQTLGKAPCVFKELVSWSLNALKQAQRDAVDMRNRLKVIGVGLPDKCLCRAEIR